MCHEISFTYIKMTNKKHNLTQIIENTKIKYSPKYVQTELHPEPVMYRAVQEKNSDSGTTIKFIP